MNVPFGIPAVAAAGIPISAFFDKVTPGDENDDGYAPTAQMLILSPIFGEFSKNYGSR
jgi:hypothetical protein